jgi:hypothetical protein
MSTYLAIAAASRTLRRLLTDRMEESVTVTLAPPDVTPDGVAGNRLNLYLYQVTENGSMKNLDLPGPPLSLNLHYLMTAYAANELGLDADLTAQQILGDAMRVFHDVAIIHPDLHELNDETAFILDPALRGESERVKLTLHPTNLDELSKIWTSLPQSHFRRSVAYEASVVLIDGGRPRGPALPVRTRRLHLTQSRRPSITAVYRTPALNEPKGDPRLRLLQELTVEGSGFSGIQTRVRLGGLAPMLVTPESDGLLRIDVPDDRFPLSNPTPNLPEEDRLQPGPQIVEVIVERATETVEGGHGRGTAGTGSQVVTSNQAVFLLVPEVAGVAPPSATAADLLTVNGRRLYRDGVKSFVLLGNAAVPIRRPLLGDPWVEPSETSVQVPIAPLAASLPEPPPGGEPYRVRVVVNGAQSLEDGVSFTLLP